MYRLSCFSHQWHTFCHSFRKLTHLQVFRVFSIQPEILVCISVIGRAFLKFLEKSTNLQGIPCKVLENVLPGIVVPFNYDLPFIWKLIPGNFWTNNVNPVSTFSEFLVKIEGALRFQLPPWHKTKEQQQSSNTEPSIHLTPLKEKRSRCDKSLLSLLTAAILLFTNVIVEPLV